MTHDELLNYIDYHNYRQDTPSIRALRAVVELHKPSRLDDGCSHCKLTDIKPRPYPCPTIEAIEKELG